MIGKKMSELSKKKIFAETFNGKMASIWKKNAANGG